jgi:hypothetical protein
VSRRQPEPAVTSEPVETEDGDEVVIQQQNTGPGNQVGGGEFKNPETGKSPEHAEREQQQLEHEAPIGDDGTQPRRSHGHSDRR